MPPETDGQWMGAQTAPGEHHTGHPGVFVIHATLMRNGKLLLFSGHAESNHYLAESWIWDPTQPVSTAQRQPFPASTDIFCCHQANLEDGRVITVGGSGAAGIHDGTGIQAICVLDPMAATPGWAKIGDMAHGRWYPTLVTLPDGRLVVFSGRREHTSGGISPTVELLSPPFTGPGYTTVTLAGGDKMFPTYPGLHLVRGGSIFHTGPTWRYETPVPDPIGTFSFRVTSATTGAWTDHATSPQVDPREEGMSILLPPAQDGRLLVIGGAKANGHPPSSLVAGSEPRAVEILDTRATPPVWTRIADMAHPRINVNAVLLPDSRVLVLGGHSFYKWDAASVNSNQAEIYDPVLDTWTAVAAMSESRTYHSAAMLLPDGRVFVAGGVDPTQSEPSTGSALNRKTFEMYHPPYFFNGTRPQITAVSGIDVPVDQIAYGWPLTIDVDVPAADIRKVALMRPGAMTHHTDSEQRYVAVDFAPVGANRVQAVVPADPSIAPPGFYMLWVVDNLNRPCQQARFIRLSRQRCEIIIDKSHYSADEVAPSSATSFTESFYVVMDGFLPSELGIGSWPPASVTAIAPAIAFERPDGSTITTMSAEATQVLAETTPPPAGLRQRFSFRYTLTFADKTIFFQSDGTTPVESQQVRLRATKDGFTGRAEVTLFQQQNPYMIDGETPWLSVDLRVFKLTQDASLFGRNVGATPSSAVAFIQNVLGDFNSDPATARTQLETTIPTEQVTPLTQLDILDTRGGQRIFNFAIAQVRYRGRTLTATDVRVFFRLFTTAATGMDFRPETYPTLPNTQPTPEPIPVLGLHGGEIASIPFFAESRVNSSIQRLDEQRDLTNVRTLNPNAAGNEVTAYFGCWLDFNQTALRYPLNPGSAVGPWSSGLQSLQHRIRGRHQCLVAEVHFPSGDPIPLGAGPGGHDNLSQRNLAIDESDNPGEPPSHIVQHTFEMRPSTLRTPRSLATAAITHVPEHGGLPSGDEYDELMILWNDLPRTSTATLYLPDCDVDEILELANRRTPHQLQKVDDDTISCTIGDVTFVPIPGGRTTDIPGLITIQLPDGIRKKQEFRVVIRQYDGHTHAIIGTFELRIPVRTAPEILPEQQETLAVMKHIALSIPTTNRWYPVFNRYVAQLGDKVRALGGDPDAVRPSSDDSGVPRPGGEGADAKQCKGLLWLGAVLLAFTIALLGWARLGGGALATWALFAILFAVFLTVWIRRCRVSACSILTMLLTGSLLGIAFLALLIALGLSPGIGVGLFAVLLLVLALIAVAILARRCTAC